MFVWSGFVGIDVFLKSFIIVSTHRKRHVLSETGFKQDSPNPNPDSLIEYPLRHGQFIGSMRVFRGIPPKRHLDRSAVLHGSPV